MSKRELEHNLEASSSSEPSEKKRKRNPALSEQELEIDISLPEPPSKKAKRREKKEKKGSDGDGRTKTLEDFKTPELQQHAEQLSATSEAPTVLPKRSEYGIWVGNLPWTATRDTLRQFLKDRGSIWDRDIVRLHLPVPAEKGRARNKGFAYIDFTSQAILDIALGLNEKLLSGRRVLIKNAKSFEGRPEKPTAGNVNGLEREAGNEQPTRKIFVGNLGFDVTQEDLTEHFGQAGEVEDIHMATFEDSGKCKGFAWIRFGSVEAAEAAVRGFLERDDDVEWGEAEEGDGGANGAKVKRRSSKPRKHFINRLHGRTLRCEFAEDAQTRYKKRHGKGTIIPSDRREHNVTVSGDGIVEDVDEHPDGLVQQAEAAAAARKRKQREPPVKKLDKEQRREERKKRHDAHTVAPGKAQVNAKRATGVIVAAAGERSTFD